MVKFRKFETINHHTGNPAWQVGIKDGRKKEQTSCYFVSEAECDEFITWREREDWVEEFIKPFIKAEVLKEQSEKYFDSMWLFWWGVMGTDIKDGLVNAIMSLKKVQGH